MPVAFPHRCKYGLRNDQRPLLERCPSACEHSPRTFLEAHYVLELVPELTLPATAFCFLASSSWPVSPRGGCHKLLAARAPSDHFLYRLASQRKSPLSVRVGRSTLAAELNAFGAAEAMKGGISLTGRFNRAFTGAIRRSWKAYERTLAEKPVLTQATTSALLWGCGDVLAQRCDCCTLAKALVCLSLRGKKLASMFLALYEGPSELWTRCVKQPCHRQHHTCDVVASLGLRNSAVPRTLIRAGLSAQRPLELPSWAQ